MTECKNNYFYFNQYENQCFLLMQEVVSYISKVTLGLYNGRNTGELRLHIQYATVTICNYLHLFFKLIHILKVVLLSTVISRFRKCYMGSLEDLYSYVLFLMYVICFVITCKSNTSDKMES